ncbi:unnamed protein product [Polarella glacialis]|uniref:Uncharacterized protein n=1 Tax=Polarella glacialis TaxID=89957 RepID=A0A813F099_POLGL|nr:unnamed protein product [Polarella glacialis]|mmetsp:Transcript_53172/g.86040  ORF Transcript_53172/g.86040 Transcript_53172/m.86040 type:complete len:112 (+) Transcript_53172:99-434(+)
MAGRRASPLLVAIVCAAVAGCLLAPAFVAPPAESRSLRGGSVALWEGASGDFEVPASAQAAALGLAVAALPEAAHAANSGYAVLQLGWAFFIISLGPAVLFWIYFNKPELL